MTFEGYHGHLTPQPHKTTTAFGSFFHPTRAVLVSEDPDAASSRWSSRDSRKHRYPQQSVPMHRSTHRDTEKQHPQAASHVSLNQRIRHPYHRLKPSLTWDVSFWVAIMFVLGSAAWICNGHLLYTPLSPTPSPEHANVAAWLAFVGGSFFAIGAYLAYVEALNAGHEEMFVELRRTVATEKQKELGNGVSEDELIFGSEDMGKERYKFRWIGTCSPRDIGYLASAVQLFAASIFWVSTVTGVPDVIPSLDTAWPPAATTIIFFWTPQVIGGTGFIVASTLLMLEEQKTWWRIEPMRIGWHVAFWNLIGAIGFTLCGALGYASTLSTKVNYQSVLSTFWGSWAFMIGSVAQLWEALWRAPPEDPSPQPQTERPSLN